MLSYVMIAESSKLKAEKASFNEICLSLIFFAFEPSALNPEL